MKFLYVVPILIVAAALGANASPSLERTRLAEPGPPTTPPWLREPALAAAGHAEVGGEGDPHAGVHAVPSEGTCTYDPGEEPGCASCGDDPDPHAGVYSGDDPHAGVYTGDPHAALAADEPAPHAPPQPVDTAPVERSRAANGKTVAEVFSARSALDQTRVTVRGTVVKLTEGVLGKNYLHLRDGTGSVEGGDDDLTVTTTEAFVIGETVEVEGQLAIDQDVGVGYSYPALLADASRVKSRAGAGAP
jgi:hypothetical protein